MPRVKSPAVQFVSYLCPCLSSCSSPLHASGWIMFTATAGVFLLVTINLPGVKYKYRACKLQNAGDHVELNHKG